jgi:hypothetical protein
MYNIDNLAIERDFTMEENYPESIISKIKSYHGLLLTQESELTAFLTEKGVQELFEKKYCVLKTYLS